MTNRTVKATVGFAAAFFATFVCAEEVSLPDGYIRLNYIESPLKQCIHTGYIPTYGDKMVLVRDFLPCVENASGKAGLYDLVEERFYGNARSGVADFKARTNRGTIVSFR